MDAVELAQRTIAGSLILWSSRTLGFDWAEHPDSESTYRYCVARINGDREVPRPTSTQLHGCIAEVQDHIDPQSYKALNTLAASIGSRVQSPARRAAPRSTDFFGLDGEPLSDEEEAAPPRRTSYGPSAEPPKVSFVNSRQPGMSTVQMEPVPLQAHVPRRADLLDTALRAAAPSRRQGIGQVDQSSRLDSYLDSGASRHGEDSRQQRDSPPSTFDAAVKSLRDFVRGQRAARVEKH